MGADQLRTRRSHLSLGLVGCSKERRGALIASVEDRPKEKQEASDSRCLLQVLIDPIGEPLAIGSLNEPDEGGLIEVEEACDVCNRCVLLREQSFRLQQQRLIDDFLWFSGPRPPTSVCEIACAARKQSCVVADASELGNAHFHETLKLFTQRLMVGRSRVEFELFDEQSSGHRHDSAIAATTSIDLDEVEQRRQVVELVVGELKSPRTRFARRGADWLKQDQIGFEVASHEAVGLTWTYV